MRVEAESKSNGLVEGPAKPDLLRQSAAEAARPYAERMESVLANVAGGVTGGGPVLLSGNGRDDVHLLVVCTAERGLCGAFNSSIVRLARELGVELHRVAPTAKHGQVTEDDLKNYVRQSLTTAPSSGGAGAPTAPPLPKFEDQGPVERVPMTAIRRATARQMSLAWTQIPHVTQNDLADVTDLEDFRRSQSASSKGPKLTMTAFALKAASILLREFPAFNSSIDIQNNQIVLKKYIHIGIAVDTEAGLLVPVVRDVDKKSVHELAAEVTAIAERARAKKLDGSELSGGTFTITNLGGIGGTGFTPIVNWPEVAILGVSRGRLDPVLKNGQWVPRLMVPLSLSYDHRVIDGAAAARFLRRMADLLEQPMHMLLHA